MKKEARFLGFDDAPFDKFKDKQVLVVGTFFRGGSQLDGILSFKVKVDGSDSTAKLIKSINKSKFKPQIQCIFLNGIAFGGFNIIDIKELSKKTKIPVIVVIRKMPDLKKIKAVLKKIKMQKKIKLIEKAGKPVKIKDVYCQLVGISPEKAQDILNIACTRSYLPEPIRAAHIIAAGIAKGESYGNP